jgi:hypothetical protein
MKPVGKPDAGIRHVRFDERGGETGRCRMAQATAPLLDSTTIFTQSERFARRFSFFSASALRRGVGRRESWGDFCGLRVSEKNGSSVGLGMMQRS